MTSVCGRTWSEQSPGLRWWSRATLRHFQFHSADPLAQTRLCLCVVFVCCHGVNANVNLFESRDDKHVMIHVICGKMWAIFWIAMIRLVSNVFWMRPWDILSLTRASHFAQTRLCLCVVFVLLSRCECECESIWVTRWQTRHDACDMWEDLSNLLDCACVYRDIILLLTAKFSDSQSWHF